MQVSQPVPRNLQRPAQWSSKRFGRRYQGPWDDFLAIPLVATILKDTQSTRDGSGRIQLALSDIGRAALEIETIPIQMDLAYSNFWNGAKIWKSSPLLAVYAGFSLTTRGQEGASFPESQIGTVLANILNELEYCMGDTSTHYGALRAEHGHPKPFKIKIHRGRQRGLVQLDLPLSIPNSLPRHHAGIS